MVLNSNRIFKKSALDGSVTIYLGKREFVDHFTHCDPIEGIILLDSSSVKDRNVYVGVVAMFRYGREEDEVLGMSFCRELYLTHKQIYPRVAGPSSSLGSKSGQLETANSWLHEKLLKKLGADALPFQFQLPCASPVSVTMLPHGLETKDTCGVRYYVRCYVASSPTEKPVSRVTSINSKHVDNWLKTLNYTPNNFTSVVNLSIRKIQYAPSWPIVGQPSASTHKDFPLSTGKVFLEATLDKKLYYHGEEINVSVLVQNYSHKTIKHVKVSVVQVADICMFSSGKWKVTVASLDSQENCPILPGSTYHKRFDLTPDLSSNTDKYGVFTNGCGWMEGENLASSTMVTDKEMQEFFGILISYQIKVKLYVGSFSPLPGNDVSIVVPFVLMYPNPILSSEKGSSLPLVSSRDDYKKTDHDQDDSTCYSDDFMFDNLAQVRVRRIPLIT